MKNELTEVDNEQIPAICKHCGKSYILSEVRRIYGEGSVYWGGFCSLACYTRVAVKTETTNQPQTLQGFTPGEWKVAKNLHGNICIYVGEYEGMMEKIVAKAMGTNILGEVLCNAKLIASAPTLLKENTQLKEQVKLLREALERSKEKTLLAEKAHRVFDCQSYAEEATYIIKKALNQTK